MIAIRHCRIGAGLEGGALDGGRRGDLAVHPRAHDPRPHQGLPLVSAVPQWPGLMVRNRTGLSIVWRGPIPERRDGILGVTSSDGICSGVPPLSRDVPAGSMTRASQDLSGVSEASRCRAAHCDTLTLPTPPTPGARPSMPATPPAGRPTAKHRPELRVQRRWTVLPRRRSSR